MCISEYQVLLLTLLIHFHNAEKNSTSNNEFDPSKDLQNNTAASHDNLFGVIPKLEGHQAEINVTNNIKFDPNSTTDDLVGVEPKFEGKHLRPLLKRKFDVNSKDGQAVSKFLRAMLSTIPTTVAPIPITYGIVISGIDDYGKGRNPTDDFLMFCQNVLKIYIPKEQIKEAKRLEHDHGYRPMFLKVSFKSAQPLVDIEKKAHVLRWQNRYQLYKYDSVTDWREQDDNDQKKILPFLQSMYPNLRP